MISLPSLPEGPDHQEQEQFEADAAAVERHLERYGNS
jgi:hypothetical protein